MSEKDRSKPKTVIINLVSKMVQKNHIINKEFTRIGFYTKEENNNVSVINKIYTYISCKTILISLTT